MQPHLANLGAGHATLRFGRVWTGAMIVQVALAAIGLPAALAAADGVARNGAHPQRVPKHGLRDRGNRPASSHVGVDRRSTFQRRRAQTYAELERRLMQAPETVAVTFADYVPGASPEGSGQQVDVESTKGGAPAFDASVLAPAVGPRFFETIGRPVVAGRDFHEGDRTGSARTVVVNEAFARRFRRTTGQGTPIGARVRRRAGGPGLENAQEPWYEIVGVARDIGLDPFDGEEGAFVYFAASPATVAPLMTLIRVRSNGGRARRTPAGHGGGR